MNDATTPAHTGLGGRLLGALILLQALLPIVIVAVLIVGVWRVAVDMNAAVERARTDLASQLAAVGEKVEAVKAESRRLMGEVDKIKNTAKDVVESVEPIRQSLVGLAGTVNTLSLAIRNILNGLIDVVNKVAIFGKLRLQPLPVPDLSIPGLHLPKLDVNLQPDLRPAQEIAGLATAMADRTVTAGRELKAQLDVLARVLGIVAALLLVWLALRLVGACVRFAGRLATGWRLLCGEAVPGALALL